MTSPQNQSTASLDTDFTKTWRYKLGFTMIVVGNLGILLGIVISALGAGAGVVGALVVGGELLSLGSIIFLGKEGFKAIKSKFVGAVKADYAKPVGKGRHYIGIALLWANMFAAYILVVYGWASFDYVIAGNLPGEFWGLDLAQQKTLAFWIFFLGEISFLVGIYILGAEWWGKFRRIFVWEGAAD